MSRRPRPHRMATLIVTALSMLAIPSVAHATDRQSFAQLMYDVSIGEFLTARAAQSPTDVDWSSDGCSTPLPVGLGDTGRSFNFRGACQRHDFGYRNAKALGIWNSTERRRIDERFLADMRADCSPRPVSQRLTCRAWATIYFNAVRVAGGP